MNEITTLQWIQNKTDIYRYVIIYIVLFLNKSCNLLLNACL